MIIHDDVIKWNHFPRYWPFVRGIQRSPVNSPQRPVTRNFDAFSDLCLNKRLSKQTWGWWFETLSRPLWCHCNGKLFPLYTFQGLLVVVLLAMCCYSGYQVSLHSSYIHLFGANDAGNMNNTHHTWGRESSDYTPPRCKPRKTVYMLRVPKTGSTTLLNIMYRYVKRYELKMPHLYLELIASRNYIIREDLMYPTEAPPPPFGSYNFYGEHIAFNQSDVDHVLGPGSFKLAAVRYPLTQFRSIFKEWHLGRKMKLSSTDPVREYLTSRLKSQDLVNANPFYTHSLTARHFGLTEKNISITLQ